MTSGSMGAADAAAVTYALDFSHAAQHGVDIEVTFPPAPAPLIVYMPVWAPGSYMVREFARHIESIAARDAQGRPLAVHKVRKNWWRIASTGEGSVHVRYRVYGRELSVRTNFIDAEFALLNGPATFLTAQAMEAMPHHVHLGDMRMWPHVAVALPAGPGGIDSGSFEAADYDALLDAPWLFGTLQREEAWVDGVPHALVTVGGDRQFNERRPIDDVARLAAEHSALWGQLPYRRYVAMNLLVGGYGGLEHKDGCVLMAGADVGHSHEAYREWLSLVSHELFHAWNVKRLRPRALGPFDYDNEVYTHGLWVAEGLTAYYDNLQVHRAGLSTREEYLRALSATIARVQAAPGRLVQTLAEASFDAWIKFYRRDEHADNTTVNYYLKGSLVGFLLDAHLRAQSGGQHSLDTVMVRAYARYAGPRGYSETQFRAVAAEVGGEMVAAFLEAAVHTTAELDYGPALRLYGLVFADSPRGGAADSARPASAGVWLGLGVRTDGDRVIVAQVVRASPAWHGGVNVADVLVAWDGAHLTPATFAAHVAQATAGQKVSLSLFRRGRLLTRTLQVGPPEPNVWSLQVDPSAGDAQRHNLMSWLGGGPTSQPSPAPPPPPGDSAAVAG